MSECPHTGDSGRAYGDERVVCMPVSELRELIRQVSHETVEYTLSLHGIDVDEPREQQADQRYLRDLRRGAEQVGRYVRRTIVITVVAALLYALWEGAKVKLGGGGG